MPFGSVFATLFFGAVCTLIAAGLVAHETLAGKLAGLFAGMLGLALACGLLTRRPWARWGGFTCATLVAGLALRLVSQSSRTIDHVLLLAAVATAGLLALPATGAPRGGRSRPARRGLGWVESTALIGFGGLVAVAVVAGVGPATTPAARGMELPGSSIPRSVPWLDLDAGLAEARSTGKPVVATFVTSWCPYCKKMRQETWRAPQVRERLASAIAVRVDVEDSAKRGPELAERYGIRGYPVQILLDPNGRVLARADGYLSPDQLLGWLDGSLARSHS